MRTLRREGGRAAGQAALSGPGSRSGRRPGERAGEPGKIRGAAAPSSGLPERAPARSPPPLGALHRGRVGVSAQSRRVPGPLTWSPFPLLEASERRLQARWGSGGAGG